MERRHAPGFGDAAARDAAATELDFERTIDGFAEILAKAGFDRIACQETRWTFEITPKELWVAVEAGIAVIGQTYQAQDTSGRGRMRSAYEKITNTQNPNAGLALPSLALIASAHRTQ